MKTLLVLFPYRFTEFAYYNFEFLHLKKSLKGNGKYKVIIHDVSDFLVNEKFNKSFKIKRSKESINFTSLISWLKEFNKIKKKSEKVIIYDYLVAPNFKTLIMKMFLKLSKLPVIKCELLEVAEWAPKKRNFKYFIKKIFEHKLNINFYFFRIKANFFSFLIKHIKFNKIFLLTNRNLKSHISEENKTADFLDMTGKESNIFLIKYHNFDYSNFLIEKLKNQNKAKKKKYIIYLDTPVPYFAGDALYDGRKRPKTDVDKWYNELNYFFDYLEKLFKSKVIIIPHRKYKIPKLNTKNLNPYFGNRITDNSYDACAKLIPNSLFVINKNSTAMSYAVASYKPIQFIYSSNYSYEP